MFIFRYPKNWCSNWFSLVQKCQWCTQWVWLTLLTLFIVPWNLFWQWTFSSHELPDACMEISLNDHKSTPENVPKLERVSTRPECLSEIFKVHVEIMYEKFLNDFNIYMSCRWLNLCVLCLHEKWINFIENSPYVWNEYLYLNFRKYIYVKWTIACKMSLVEEIFLLKSPNFKFSTHKKWIITLYWVFFVDFLSIEGHFRLKKLKNYRKNLVWKSVFD